MLRRKGKKHFAFAFQFLIFLFIPSTLSPFLPTYRREIHIRGSADDFAMVVEAASVTGAIEGTVAVIPLHDAA